MRMKLLTAGPLGKKGDELTGPADWKYAFPLHGSAALAADDEARAAILASLATVTPARTRERLANAMKAAGTYPTAAEPPPPPPKKTKAKTDTANAEKSLTDIATANSEKSLTDIATANAEKSLKTR